MARCGPSFARGVVRINSLLAISSIVSSISTDLLGQVDPNTQPESIFLFTLDNDVFNDSDQAYTNGTRISQIFAKKVTNLFPEGSKKLGEMMMSQESGAINGGWYISQSIFTPEDPEKIELGPEDRPYAGWLGGGLWVREVERSRSRSLGLSLGVAGPDAYAEETQDFIHDLIGSEEFAWSEQIQNEFTLNLHLRERKRVWEGSALGILPGSFDLELGGDLGNLQLGLTGRALLQFGAYGPIYYFPTERYGPGGEIIPNRNVKRSFHLNGYVGIEGSYIAHNIFLDGETNRPEILRESEDFVGSIVAGLIARWNDWGIGYAYVYRSEEFTGQVKPHAYGQLVIGWRL